MPRVTQHPRLAAALRAGAGSDGAWIGLLLLALLGAELIGACWAPLYTYDRWDNFEYYTPMIVAAHRTLLGGEIPTWNPHQHLGESFLANPQMGTFYPPYTLAYLAVQALELPWKWLCNLIATWHTSVGAAGAFLLLRHFGARRSLAFIGALGLASAGYLRAVAALWIFLAPNFAWLPWTLLCGARLVEGSRQRRYGLGFALTLVAQAYVGHPQLLVYVWLTVGLFCLGYALVVQAPLRQRLGRLGRLALVGLGAGLLSAVSMLPLFMHIESTGRKAPLAFAQSVVGSVSLEALLGLLLPFYGVSSGFILKEQCSLMLHQAGWLLPALALGVPLWVESEWRRSEARRLGRVAALFAVVGGVMLLFALGENGKLYGLTYGLPVWSSFRYPHKFLICALPCLGVAAALSLELSARDERLRTWHKSLAAGLFVALAAWGFGVGWAEIVARPWARAGLCSALLLVGLAPLVSAWQARVAMALAGVVSAASMVALAQTFAPSAFLEPHVPDPDDHAPPGPNRVLPVHLDKKRYDLVPRLLYQSATMLGVDSVTGCTTSMAPDWYLSWLPSNPLGLLPERVYRELLPSHFLRALNVEYAVAPKGRGPIPGWLRRAGFELVRELEKVDLYRIDDTLPRAYFASGVRPYTRQAFHSGLIRNRADVRTAYVEPGAAGEGGEGGEGGEAPPVVAAGPRAPAQVLSADFSEGESASFEVDAPAGGFLVISMAYDPSFRAFVDGEGARVWRTNAMLMGIEVPPGRHQLRLSYENAALGRGFGLGAAGLLLLAALYARAPGKGSPIARASRARLAALVRPCRARTERRAAP